MNKKVYTEWALCPHCVTIKQYYVDENGEFLEQCEYVDVAGHEFYRGELIPMNVEPKR